MGSNVLCSLATLTAKKLISLNGLTATCGSNVLDVNATNTTITGPLTLNGTVTGSGVTSLLGGYATSTALNAKENSITIVSPLVKTVGTGVNQLSLDTTAAYNVGSLTASGKITCTSLTFNGTTVADLGGYATTTALNAKENLLAVVSPLLKTTVLTGPLAGMNQLSLDPFAVYDVGALNCTAGPVSYTHLTLPTILRV